MRGHSYETLSPYTSKLSIYCRAVSNRLRVTSAHRSLSRILNVAVSTANGEPYFAVSCGLMRPEPWQTTLLASLPGRHRQGLTQCVA